MVGGALQSSAWAQNRAGAPAPSSAARPSAPASANSTAYVLGPRDVISITVNNYPEFSQARVVVPPDGVLSLPFYGSVRATGRTRAQLEADLLARLRREMRNPRLSVSIIETRPTVIGQVFFVGEATTASAVEVRANTRLAEALAPILVRDVRLEEQSAVLVRAGQNAVTLSPATALAQPNSPSNIVLRPGDVITFTRRNLGRITVLGDVTNPGVYELRARPRLGELGHRPRLSEVLTVVGGLSEAVVPSAEGQTAAPRALRFEAFVQRGTERVPVDVRAALQSVGGAFDVTLLPGDVLSLSRVRPMTVYIEGFASRTGPVQVEPGTTVLELLSLAGGLTQPVERIDASVRRGTTLMPINLSAMLLSPDSADPVLLRDGDALLLREPEVIRVQVAGSVANAGPLRLRPQTTLLEALVEAGGLRERPETVDLNVLRRQDGGQVVLSSDPVTLLSLSDLNQNFVLADGDLVNVSPKRTRTVFVSGQVNTPGSHPLNEGEGLLELITRAGGPRETAALTKVTIERDGQRQVVDVYDAVRQGQPLEVPIQQGDFVFVPENTARVTVVEAVARPGHYPVPERGELTLLEALTAAGGPSAQTREVVLMRVGPKGLEPRRISMDDIRRGQAGATVLQPDDVIYVPADRVRPDFFTRLTQGLGLFRLFSGF